MPKDVSIIIPVLEEAPTVNQTLKKLKELPHSGAHEIIVVDGNIAGNTLRAIAVDGIMKIKAPPGRGIQMNAGARAASGRILLFLHADTRLPENAIDLITSACRSKRIIGGAFDLRIDSGNPVFRVIEKLASIRSRLNRIPYGDQAIFMTQKTFAEIGGFNEIPIMEDIDLMQRIKQAGHKIHIIADPVRTSARRWEREGIVFCTVRNIVLSSLFYLGASPQYLKKYYK